MVRQAKWLLVIVAAAGLVAVAGGCNRSTSEGAPPIELGPAPGETITYDETVSSPAPTGISTPGSGYPATPTGGYDTLPPPPPPPVATSRPATHTVARGDTLFSIARQYYGDQSKWRSIYEANKDQLPNQNMLKVGQVLKLP